MCYVCSREFRGWCRSFTITEILLSILEGVLLLILNIFLVFLILHLLACSKRGRFLENVPTVTAQCTTGSPAPTTSSSIQTVAPHIICTWEPSQTTVAMTHYYEVDQRITLTSYNVQTVNTTYVTYTASARTENYLDINSSDITTDWSDGVEAAHEKQFTLALVKIRPPQEVTFGCILTIITKYWVLTAASCIEAIEEIDSLDSFVMMEGYGEVTQGRLHTVDNVRIHPWYQGTNRSYDLVALKSEDSLINERDIKTMLPTILDYLMVSLGEKFTILGYGKYRTIDDGPTGRALRKVDVYILPRSQCPEGVSEGEAWSMRHLWRGREVRRRGRGPRGVCAGPRGARAGACNYCAGAPLLRGALLLGLMADTQQCGVTCAPALYVNLAILRDWLDHVVYNT